MPKLNLTEQIEVAPHENMAADVPMRVVCMACGQAASAPVDTTIGLIRAWMIVSDAVAERAVGRAEGFGLIHDGKLTEAGQRLVDEPLMTNGS